jgi:hypothetical protein
MITKQRFGSVIIFIGWIECKAKVSSTLLFIDICACRQNEFDFTAFTFLRLASRAHLLLAFLAKIFVSAI